MPSAISTYLVSVLISGGESLLILSLDDAVVHESFIMLFRMLEACLLGAYTLCLFLREGASLTCTYTYVVSL